MVPSQVRQAAARHHAGRVRNRSFAHDTSRHHFRTCPRHQLRDPPASRSFPLTSKLSNVSSDHYVRTSSAALLLLLICHVSKSSLQVFRYLEEYCASHAAARRIFCCNCARASLALAWPSVRVDSVKSPHGYSTWRLPMIWSQPPPRQAYSSLRRATRSGPTVTPPSSHVHSR